MMIMRKRGRRRTWLLAWLNVGFTKIYKKKGKDAMWKVNAKEWTKE